MRSVLGLFEMASVLHAASYFARPAFSGLTRAKHTVVRFALLSISTVKLAHHLSTTLSLLSGQDATAADTQAHGRPH